VRVAAYTAARRSSVRPASAEKLKLGIDSPWELG